MDGFRVVDKSSLAIEVETDLPSSRRNVHPSGVLHARSSNRDEPNDDVFVWVENSLHVESAIDHLERMHDRRDVVFIPYSSSANWLATYPQARFDLEYGKDESKGMPRDDDDDDLLLLPEAERNELHLEIWNYLSWFHARLAAAEEANAAAESAAANAYFSEWGRYPPGRRKGYLLKKNHGVELSELKIAIDRLEEAFVVISNAKLERAEEEEEETLQQQQNQQQPHVELERSEEEEEEEEEEESTSDMAEVADLMVGAQEGSEGEIIEQPQSPSQLAPSDASAVEYEKVPFLQEALSSALSRRVAARELRGDKRRGRKRPRSGDEAGSSEGEENCAEKKKKIAPPRRDFEEMFDRLLEYREEHGDCLVPKVYEADLELSSWVRCLRWQMKDARRLGIEPEEAPPSDKRRARTLNAERISRLEGIGFVWMVNGPFKPEPWEDQFQELMEYYRENGKWPLTRAGKLGSWVVKQRVLYAKKDAYYMRRWAPKLDEVGFEWTATVNKRKALITSTDPYGDNQINLPRPRNGSVYRKPEVVAILSVYDDGSLDRGLAIDKMIRLGYVPCTVRTMRRLMERRKKGQPIPDTDWHQSVGPRTKKTEGT